MGQAAGVKRRKRRAGNFNILKNCKSQHKRQQHVYKAGLEFLGLEDSVGGKCLMTRVSEGGLVANLKHFNKPDPLMFVRQAKAAMEKKTAPSKATTAASLVGNVENRRKMAKQKVVERRTVSIPKSQAKFLSYFLDRYGQDYKEMVTDPMNYDQFTWKQFRTKVESFKNSVQYVDYLKDRGLMPTAPSSSSKDDGNNAQSEDELEDAAAETPEERMLAKIAEMEQEEKLLKKKMTVREKKSRTAIDEVVNSSDGEESSDDDEMEQTTSAMAIKKTEQNAKRRNRAKKFKVAKRKRLQKEQHKLGF